MAIPELVGKWAKILGNEQRRFAESGDERILEAWELAKRIHKDDLRDTGAPWTVHCEAVAEILHELGGSPDEVIAGLLHDTVEDHPDLITLDEIENRFGKRVRFLVDGATKFSVGGQQGTDFQTHQKIVRETHFDNGVAKLKLADRLHNMSSLDGVPESKQKRQADETLRLHVPMAKALGMWKMAKVLEDIAFYYADRQLYQTTKAEIDNDPRLNNALVGEMANRLSGELSRLRVGCEIEIGFGGYHQLFEKRKYSAVKMGASPKGFKDIEDLISIRLITGDDLQEIYQVVGIVMRVMGSNIDQRIRNRVATPATNGYRAIHMTYHTEEGPIEIAVAGRKMEEFNQNGISAEIPPEEMEALIRPVVMVFTPNHDLLFMPRGAKVIDVAYKLNRQLGMQAIGAVVNEKFVNLDYEVNQGDLIQIVPANEVIYKPDELHLAYCNQDTREMILEQLKLEERRQIERQGRDYLEEVTSRFGVLNLADLDESVVVQLATQMGCENIQQIYIKVGQRKEYAETVGAILTAMGIDKVGYSTLALRGRDRKGIAAEVSAMISKLGGRILSNREKVETVDGVKMFKMRKLIIDLDERTKESLKEQLKKKKIYEDIILV